MAAARAALEAERRSGDLIVHSPLLSMRALAGLGDVAASPALPVEALRASRRVLVLDVPEQPMHGFGDPTTVTVIAGSPRSLVLASYAPTGGAQVTLFDLYTDIAGAQMQVERPAGTVSSHCTKPRAEGGRSCPGEPEWLYIGQRALVIEGKSAACVWAHPTTGGVIVFELPALPAPPEGKVLRLSFEAALADDAATGTPDGASVETEVMQGGASLGTFSVPNRVGWVRRQLTIAADAQVSLRVSTARDGRRHHCLNARIEEVAP